MCFLSARKTPNNVAYIKSQQSVMCTHTLYPTEADPHFSNVKTAHQLNLAIDLLLACDMLIDNLHGGLAQTTGGFC